MRAPAVVAWSAVGTIVFYVAWVIAAADDYEGGFKHLAAVTTGVLALACLVALAGSLALVMWRWVRRRG